ncbi:MAG: EAL domain-containing protein [Sulfuriferula sp.]
MTVKLSDSLAPIHHAAPLDGISALPCQEVLLKTNALYNAIFNCINLSGIATDEKGVIQLFNVGAERMLGYTAAEVVNKITPADISDQQEVSARAKAFSVEHANPITQGFEALAFKASCGIEDVFELTYIRKDGGRVPTRVSVTALCDAQNAIIGYLFIGTDITVHKHSDGISHASEEHYRMLMQSIDEGFCIIEKLGGEADEPLDFRYLEANPAFVAQSGLTSVVGKTLRQVIPIEFDQYLFRYDSVLKTGEPIRFEHGSDSQGRVLELYAFRIQDATHRRVGVSFNDITERKLAEDGLRESVAFNRSVIKSSPDCIKVLDVKGNLLSMQSGQELLGIEDIRPFLNTSWIDFWEGEHLQAAQAAVALAAAGEIGKFVGFFRTFYGEPKWWDVSVSPILDTNGKPDRLLAVSRDVTKRRQAEKNLEFLASVSQDLVHWTNVGEMIQTVGAKMAAYLQLSICALAEINDTAEQVVINYEWHRKDVPSLVGVYRLADFVGEEFIRVARAGEVIVVRNAATDPRTDPEKFVTLRIASFVCVPLILDGQWRFALCLYHSVAYDWRDDEIVLMRELTTRIWTRLEQLRVEAALRESEQRFRMLFESIDEGFCIIERIVDEAEKPLDFRYIEANPAFKVQSGASDVVGKTIRQAFPDESEEWFLTYDTVLRTGEPIRFERKLIAQGRMLELYAFRVEDEIKRCVAVVFKDITVRKQAEEVLRQRTTQFETLLDQAPLGVYLIDSDFRIRQVNPTALPVFGNIFALIGQDFGQVMHILWPKAKADKIVQRFRHTLETGEPLNIPKLTENRLDRETTEYYEWQINRIPLPDDSFGVVCYFRDISERILAQQKMRESEERYLNLFNTIDEGFCVIEMIFDDHEKAVDYHLLEVNPSYEKQSGIRDAAGKRMLELVPAIEASWFEIFGKVALTGEPMRFVNEMNALKAWFNVYAFRIDGPGSWKVAVIFTNITENKEAEKALHTSVRELREAESGLRTTEVALSKEKAALADHVLQLQQANEHLIGATVEAHMLSEEIEKARVHMAHLAQHDTLTDLPNRILLNDRLTQAITLAHRQGKQFAVMFLDLDRFKHINDSLGHSVGDQLLQSVAKRLAAVIRNSDTVCRQGGDEFVILLADVEHAQDAAFSAQKILTALATSHVINQLEIHVTVSIGISIYPENGRDADSLIKNADTAMYHAKEGGRDKYQFFEPQMNVLAVERHAIEAGLHLALERKEFVLYYQPKINLKSGNISGVEALIRWQHPHRGLILPEQFVWIAEDCGLIVPLGAWVLREACRQAQAWQDAGLASIPVAANISAVQFRHKDFLASLAAILKDTGLAPNYLELELTESVLMHDADSTICVLKALKAMGVQLAIDDFGTGYSSLSYLKRFPIDTLKIDQSFMRDITHATTDSDDAAIVAAVVSMGKSLNQRVIAEGVETREQLAFLQAQGCGEGQGFYFSRPVSAQALGELLRTGILPTIPG